jgi:phosphodiesterase/alkaline phosphatase D-like protein
LRRTTRDCGSAMKGATHSPGRSPWSAIAAAASFMPAANFSLGVQSPTISSQPSSIWTVSNPSAGSCGTILSRSARETFSYSEYQDDHTVPGSSPRTPYRSASRSR